MIASRRIACIAVVFAACCAPDAGAQSRPAPAAEVISLQTRDGVKLGATYFPSGTSGNAAWKTSYAGGPATRL